MPAMALPWGHRLDALPLPYLSVVMDSHRCAHRFRSFGLLCGGLKCRTSMCHGAWLAAGHGGLTGATVQPTGDVQNAPRHQILDGRLGLNRTTTVCNRSTVDRGLGPQRRVSAHPRHMVHRATHM